jgi:hypothetical protein
MVSLFFYNVNGLVRYFVTSNREVVPKKNEKDDTMNTIKDI